MRHSRDRTPCAYAETHPVGPARSCPALAICPIHLNPHRPKTKIGGTPGNGQNQSEIEILSPGRRVVSGPRRRPLALRYFRAPS
jgi:hypothetical protein